MSLSQLARKSLFVILVTLVPTAIANCQSSSSARQTAQSQSKPSSAGPVTMTECEGTNNCATWTFLGKQGNGQWPSGEMANLTVEDFDADTVVIDRADSTGNSAGLTATYRGTRHGNRIGGEYTSSWPGHWDKQEGNWYATIGKAPQSIPMVMHICIRCDTGMGGTATWDKDHYLILPDVPGQRTVLTVESFTSQSVILHRTNSGRYPGTAVLTGQISAQGNSIVNGIQTSPDGSSHPFQAAWGTAINTVSGTRGADPVVVARPVFCYGWFFVVCE
jgi:hypothetical protein